MSMKISSDPSSSVAARLGSPVVKTLHALGLFTPLRRVNRQLYRMKCERRALRGRGLVPEQRLRSCYRDAVELLKRLDPDQPPGDYLEFGVGFGSTMACMHEALEAIGENRVRMFGFDSFAGLPDVADEEDYHGWSSGQILSTEKFARRLLTSRGIDWSRAVLVKGWFDDTLTAETAERLAIRRAGVILVDSDLYASAVVALRFCEPLIGRHAVIAFDEWNAYRLAERGLGEKQAFDEFLARNPDIGVVEELPSYHPNAAVFLLERRIED